MSINKLDNHISMYFLSDGNIIISIKTFVFLLGARVWYLVVTEVSDKEQQINERISLFFDVPCHFALEDGVKLQDPATFYHRPSSLLHCTDMLLLLLLQDVAHLCEKAQNLAT